MFFFQSMFQTVYIGLSGSAALSAVQTAAEGLLLLCALFAVYEAYSRGGDARALAVAGVRYLIMGLVLTQYSSVFGAVNHAFNSVAQTISPNDVVTNYRAQLADYWNSLNGMSDWWKTITGGLAAFLSVLFQLIALLLFPITYTIFSFFYSLYGAVLYLCGPLVLALYPAFGVGQLARTYMVNLMIWNAWGIIYAIMSQLLTIMNAGSLDAIAAAQNFGGIFQGASQVMLIALSSILISLMIALIPVIASRIVSGDVGSTMFLALSAAGNAVQTAAVAVAGIAGGMAGGGASGTPPPGPPKPPEDSASLGQVDGANGGQEGFSNLPPRGPGDNHGQGNSGSSRAPRPYVSGLQWMTYEMGRSAGRTVRAVRDTFSSGDKEKK
jgi:hypothetical protein